MSRITTYSLLSILSSSTSAGVESSGVILIGRRNGDGLAAGLVPGEGGCWPGAGRGADPDVVDAVRFPSLVELAPPGFLKLKLLGGMSALGSSTSGGMIRWFAGMCGIMTGVGRCFPLVSGVTLNTDFGE